LVYLEIHDTFNRKPKRIRIRRYVAEALFGSFISKAIPLDHKASIGVEVIQEPRYRVEAKPMAKGELWRVVVQDRTLKNTLLSQGRTYEDNLSKDEATKLADALQAQLNPRSQEPTTP
jgi:hypothetical protein